MSDNFVEVWNDATVRLQWCTSHLNTAQHITTLMAFFAVTAAVELQFHEDHLSEPLLVAYVCTTCLLVAITVIVKIVGTSILSHLGGGRNPLESPHDQMFDLICLCCLLGHIVAPFLFCLDLQLIAWIRFGHFVFEAGLATSAIIVPVQVVILLFGRVLFKKIVHLRRLQRKGLFPTRRYSEIAEMWAEDEYDEEMCQNDDSPLLRSATSVTSYGAILTYDSNLNQFKACAPFY